MSRWNSCILKLRKVIEEQRFMTTLWLGTRCFRKWSMNSSRHFVKFYSSIHHQISKSSSTISIKQWWGALHGAGLTVTQSVDFSHVPPCWQGTDVKPRLTTILLPDKPLWWHFHRLIRESSGSPLQPVLGCFMAGYRALVTAGWWGTGRAGVTRGTKDRGKLLDLSLTRPEMLKTVRSVNWNVR